jgi:hypothetical protein
MRLCTIQHDHTSLTPHPPPSLVKKKHLATQIAALTYMHKWHKTNSPQRGTHLIGQQEAHGAQPGIERLKNRIIRSGTRDKFITHAYQKQANCLQIHTT